MKILSVNRGTAESVPGKRYKSGIWKTAVSGTVMVDEQGLVGDAICNRKHHGGPDQAVYIEGGETLKWWEAELGRPLEPGAFGENLSIAALDNRELAAGDTLTIGDVILEATSPRIPCATFAIRMQDPTFPKRYTKAARPGAYFRVVVGGMLEAGQPVSFIPYGGERVTMAEMMEQFGRRLEGETLQRYLAAPIGARYRQMLLEKS